MSTEGTGAKYTRGATSKMERPNWALWTLWIAGVLTIVGGFIARPKLVEAADDAASVESMTRAIMADSGAAVGDWRDVVADYSNVQYAAWAIGFGVLMLVLGLTVTALRHKP